VSFWRHIDIGLSAIERLAKLILAIGVVAGAVTTLVIFIRGHKVGAWVPIVVALPLVLVIVLAYLVGRRDRRRDSTEIPATRGLNARERELERAVASAEYEKRLMWDVLENIQQAIASEENWELDQVVERGVLGPARGLLTQEREEDVRLSVLEPHKDDPTCFQMRWAAGHLPQSVKNYKREIDKTLAGIAFRRGEFVQSDDVEQDERFARNPKATRDFRSLVSMPLPIDEKIVAAFTVVSTRPAAFGPTDVSFIKLIGAVLDVLLASEFDGDRWAAYAAAQRKQVEPSPTLEEKAPEGA
jgi:GAF domain